MFIICLIGHFNKLYLMGGVIHTVRLGIFLGTSLESHIVNDKLSRVKLIGHKDN